MKIFILNNLDHFLFVLLFISRLGDIVSTYLATPNLVLETNPIIRKLRWPYAVFTIFVCFIPYYDTGVALILLAPSLLVSSSNFSRLWFITTLGEKEYKKLLLAVRRKGNYDNACYCMGMSGIFMFLLGFLLLMVSPKDSWPLYIGFGIEIYSLVILLYGFLYNRKLFQESIKDPYELIVRKVENQGNFEIKINLPDLRSTNLLQFSKNNLQP